MPTPSHIRELWSVVGPELLLVSSVAVLARDTGARALLVENADADQWTL